MCQEIETAGYRPRNIVPLLAPHRKTPPGHFQAYESTTGHELLNLSIFYVRQAGGGMHPSGNTPVEQFKQVLHNNTFIITRINAFVNNRLPANRTL